MALSLSLSLSLSNKSALRCKFLREILKKSLTFFESKSIELKVIYYLVDNNGKKYAKKCN